MDGKKNKKQFSCLFLGLFGPIALCEGKGASRPTAAGQRSLRDRALLCDPPRIQDVGARGYGLGLQVEGELPLLSERGIAHLHRQAPITGAPAVQAQITPHVSQFGVILDLFPFLQHTRTHTHNASIPIPISVIGPKPCSVTRPTFVTISHCVDGLSLFYYYLLFLLL